MSILDNFNYRITGEDHLPKVVFLHGLMGFLNNWGSITRRLSSKYQCLVYDQRGHGKSIKPLSGYHPRDFAEDLFQILGALKWPNINLVGHSMGGRNALFFSYLYPERLISLTVEDIGPESDPDGFVYYQKMLDTIPTPFASRAEMVAYFENRFVLDFNSKESPQTIVPFLIANLEEKSDGRFNWRFSKEGIISSVKEGRGEDAWPLIEKISVPTLYLRGQNSKDLSKSVFDQVLSRNPLITGVEVSDAGHWIHSDQPEVFSKELESFLDGINH